MAVGLETLLGMLTAAGGTAAGTMAGNATNNATGNSNTGSSGGGGAGPTHTSIFQTTSPEAITNAQNWNLKAIQNAMSSNNEFAYPTSSWNQFTPVQYNNTGIQQPGLVNPSNNIYNQELSNYNPVISQLQQLAGNMKAPNPTGNQITDMYKGLAADPIMNLYNSGLQALQPYIDLGTTSANQLSGLSGANGTDTQQTAINNLLNSPLIQGQLGLGTQAINNSASASNMLRSGNVLQELQKYGQDLAGTSVNNFMQQLLGQSQLGVTAQGQQSAGQLAGEQYKANNVNNLSGFLTNLSNARDTNAINANALALSGENARAGLLQNQASAQTANQQQQYSNALNQYNTQYTNQYNSALAQYQAGQQAQQNYLNTLMNLQLAQGNTDAQAELGRGQQFTTMSTS